MSKNIELEYAIGDTVRLVDTMITGTITGICLYMYAENSYLLDYVDTIGMSQENWFGYHRIESLQ